VTVCGTRILRVIHGRLAKPGPSPEQPRRNQLKLSGVAACGYNWPPLTMSGLA
jgi:hypothetical protein